MGELVLEERDAVDEKGEERGCPVCGTPFAAGHTREDCAAHAEAAAARLAACDAKDASQLQQSEALNSLLALWRAHLPLLAAYAEDWKAAGAAYERLRAAEAERRRAWEGERGALAALQDAKSRAAAGRELAGLAAQVKDRLEEVAALAKRIAASGSDIARAVRDGAGGDGAARAAALDKDLSQLQAEHDEAVNAASELQRQLNELRGRQNKAAAGLLQAREKLNREQGALERVEALSRTSSALAARLAEARAENKRAAQELNTADDALKTAAAAAAVARDRLRQETDRLTALLGFSQAQAGDMQAFAARMGDLDARIRSAAHAAGLGLDEAAAHSRQLAEGAAEGAGRMSLDASSVASSAAGGSLAASGGAAAAASDAFAAAQEAERRLREQVDALTAAIDAKRVQLGAVQHSRGLFSALRRVHEMREQQAAANEARRALSEELRDESDASAALSGDASPESSLQAVQFELQGVLLAMKEAEGRLKELYASVDDAQRTLQRDSYRTAEKRAHALLIKTHTLELAIKDLDRYHTALDKALARYHQLKIAEINATIRELWGNTYAGNDIDAIEIRSDLDDEAAAAAAGAGGAGAAGRASRSYNYRVVMMKGDAELDMRGRCSAGQKVLASIVIRLALAESFCCSTGIMALDEPTTNLVRGGPGPRARRAEAVGVACWGDTV
jgi:DNA repair protein RAD50